MRSLCAFEDQGNSTIRITKLSTERCSKGQKTTDDANRRSSPFPFENTWSTLERRDPHIAWLMALHLGDLLQDSSLTCIIVEALSLLTRKRININHVVDISTHLKIPGLKVFFARCFFDTQTPTPTTDLPTTHTFRTRKPPCMTTQSDSSIAPLPAPAKNILQP